MVDVRDPHREAVAEHRHARRGQATLVQAHQDLPVDPVEPVLGESSGVAEADDVERRRSQQFQVGGAPDELGQVPRLADVLLDDPGVALDAVLLEAHPDLERPEATAQLQAEVRRPVMAGRHAPVEPGQVPGRRGKGIAMGLPVPHQCAAGLEGHAYPLVQVKGDRIGLLQCRRPDAAGPAPARPGRRRRRRRGTRSLPARKGCQAGQIIGGAGVDGTGVPHDADRDAAVGPVPRNRRLERRDLDLVLGIDRDDPKAIRADAHQFDRFEHGIVGLARGVDRERARSPPDSCAPDIVSGPGVPGDDQARPGWPWTPRSPGSRWRRPGSPASPCTSR